MPHPPTADWPEWPLVHSLLEVHQRLTDAYRKRDERHLSTAYPLLDAVGTSTATLVALCQHHNIRDGYVIARVIYETIINAAFIVGGGIDVAERAWRHALQKSLRDLDRSIELAGKTAFTVKWSGADIVLANPANQALIQEFTSKSGREITSWTPESVRERLEAIQSRFGEGETRGLIFGLLLYRHASEVAHGTLYGALFSLGATGPSGLPKSVEELREYRIDHTRMLLMLTGFAIESLVVILSREINASELGREATQIRKAFSERRRPDA